MKTHVMFEEGVVGGGPGARRASEVAGGLGGSRPRRQGVLRVGGSAPLLKQSALGLCLTLLGGCYSPLKVSSTHCSGGLPFYAKIGVLRQVTEYQGAWTVATVTLVPLASGEAKPQLPDATRYASTAGELLVLNALEKALIRETSYPRVELEGFMDLPTSPPAINALNLTLTANTVERVAVVDYERRWYLVPSVPWFGKGTFEPAFAADGTLTKLKIESDSHPEALAELLPIKGALSTLLVAEVPPPDSSTTDSPTVMALRGAQATSVKVTLERKRQGLRRIATRDHCFTPGEKTISTEVPPPLPEKWDLFRILPLAPSSPRPSTKKDEGAYVFSGSLTPPKKSPKKSPKSE